MSFSSCWFLQRKLLGPQRFWMQSIKEDKASHKWRAMIYEAPWQKAYYEQALQGLHTLKRMGRNVNLNISLVGTSQCPSLSPPLRILLQLNAPASHGMYLP